MTLLDNIQRGTRPQPRRTMLYGVHGVGKSTFAASATRPIFLPTEDGLNDVGPDRFPLITSYSQVLEALAELYREEHQYQTVAVDSLDWLERLVLAEVCRDRGVPTIEDIGYGKGYVFALDLWREVLDGLDVLRTHRGMGVVLIAHAKVGRFEHPETDTFDRFVPRLHP